ncbi:uncharacterized protein LOC127259633 [Andrographis paniculata]|uniref:uncharacterized protein LOC127259633 n=1 Tax=Andrographis paniculata TaxID=175694 RepID=UPI0021E94EAA|nr:uncharacterized protein LOC127259633 [Andrographis paniculata]XP_051143055.1 uncharacterized protein LOC127259633 [Andrographis paniculata]XP_051143057.1 uncharacterized protein LOC127259633 [Andrographis paniculata]
MMNLSSMGSGFGGNSSSSSSNLSALAPPFTVDRLNPNFNSSPLLHYSDSPSMVEPFSHAWEYARPSAPGPELVIRSTGETGVHLADGYRFSTPAPMSLSSGQWSAPSPGTQASGSAFVYGGEIKPYYPTYNSPMVEEDTPLVPNQGSQYNFGPAAGTSHTSQLDYTRSSFDLPYGPRWGHSSGFDDGKRAKRVEPDRNFFYDNGGSNSHSQLDRGGYSTGTWSKFKEEFDFSYTKFNQGSDLKFHSGALNVGNLDDKHIGKEFCLFSDDAKKANIMKSDAMYQEPHPPHLLGEMDSIPNYKSSYTPFHKCIRPDDTAFTGPSVLRSSPTVVIRPPPATNVDVTQAPLSHKAHNINNEGVQNVDCGRYNPSKKKDIGMESSFKINDNDPENLINFSKQGSGLFPSGSVKDMSSLCSTGVFDHKINTRCVPQLQPLTLSGGSALAWDNSHVDDSADAPSDFADTHNLGVDSPCWKGAPSSKISQFDVDFGTQKNVGKFFGEYCGFDQAEDQNLHSIVVCDGVSSEKSGHVNKSSQSESSRMDDAYKLGRATGALCSSSEQILLDDARCHEISTTTNNEGVTISADLNMMRNDCAPPRNLTVFNTKDCHTKHLVDEEGAGIMNLTYACEGGDVAVHAAEKVLDSPASQDTADKHPKLPDPELHVPTIIKTMHNLSELLLFHFSDHVNSIDEESTESLKYTISNLDLCLSKKNIPATDKPKSNKPVGGTSEELGESCDLGAVSENNATNEPLSSNFKLESRVMREDIASINFSGQCGKKDKKLLKHSPFVDDLDMTGDDDVAKAIKRILEENFHLDEELHPQAFLFKNLWLEAEAKLCSTSYKSRFDRMKILLEESRLTASQALSTASQVPPKTYDGTNLKSTLQDYSTSSGDGNEIEASVMKRLNILKSREENQTSSNVEEEWQPGMVDGMHAPSDVHRINALKSFESNKKSVDVEEKAEHITDLVDGEHANSVMTRFNILKSREGNPNLITMEEERKPEKIDGVHPPSIMKRLNILMSCHDNSKTVGAGEEQSKAVHGNLNAAQLPDQIGSLGLVEGRFGVFIDEFHLSAVNGPIMHPFNSSNITNGDTFGSRGSSSDWEHVLKDEVPWKK